MDSFSLMKPLFVVAGPTNMTDEEVEAVLEPLEIVFEVLLEAAKNSLKDIDARLTIEMRN